MEKSSMKMAFFAALLVFAAGTQLGAEARNINIPCKTVKNCVPAGHCKCIMNLCICHPVENVLNAQALIGNNIP
uniref:Bifunctional inhibitor/plant lipid transfer protein/seed storage helical domain-containing protein n=1 Tax=Populus trichocarpa TaxID=3694 RepID=A0A3N7G3C2_POPTR